MSAIVEFIRRMEDSPTCNRHRAGRSPGDLVGTTALLLNGGVMGFVVLLMFLSDDPVFRLFFGNLPFGQQLSFVLLAGATVISTVVIPGRMLSILAVPRTQRYFDQIVLSGISPFRFLIGRVLSQNRLVLRRCPFTGCTSFCCVCCSVPKGGEGESCAPSIFLKFRRRRTDAAQ